MNLPRIWRNGWAVLRARWYLRKADTLGPKARVWGRPVVYKQGSIHIGSRLRLISTIAVTELAATNGGRLEIGESVFINYGCSISANQQVRIGDRCSIGTHCIIMDNDFHQVNPERRQERPPSAPIVLEENVWLGARAIVLKGVTIGRNSVIGAGSVVTRDVPPRCLAAGVPARVIRTLGDL